MAINLSKLFGRGGDNIDGIDRDTNQDGLPEAQSAISVDVWEHAATGSGPGAEASLGMNVVDAADYTVWRDNLRSSTPPPGILANIEQSNLVGDGKFTASEDQIRTLMGNLEQRGLIDTSTGEIVWADAASPSFTGSDEELGALVAWLRTTQPRGDGSGLGAGFTIADDLINEARAGRGHIGETEKNVLPPGDGDDAARSMQPDEQSFTAAEGRSMSFELFSGGGPEADPGAYTLPEVGDQVIVSMLNNKNPELARFEAAGAEAASHANADGIYANNPGGGLLGVRGDEPTQISEANALWQLIESVKPGEGAADGGAAARSMQPGHEGDGFMMQDGELYPRGLRDMEIELRIGGGGETANPAESPNIISTGDHGYTATDDLWQVRGEARGGEHIGETEKNALPGTHGDGFMMQDGELYPRGLLLPYMEQDNLYKGSDQQMTELVGHLRERGLIDTSTGEIVWAHGAAAEASSDSEMGALISWLHGNNLIDTSTGEILWTRQPAGARWFVPDMDSDQSAMATGGGSANARSVGAHESRPSPTGDGTTEHFFVSNSHQGYTATDDLWKIRDGAPGGAGTDSTNRSMQPGREGQGFMMQDGELYPRGINEQTPADWTDVQVARRADGWAGAGAEGTGRSAAPNSGKWEGPDFDAGKNEVSIETLELRGGGLHIGEETGERGAGTNLKTEWITSLRGADDDGPSTLLNAPHAGDGGITPNESLSLNFEEFKVSFRDAHPHAGSHDADGPDLDSVDADLDVPD